MIDLNTQQKGGIHQKRTISQPNNHTVTNHCQRNSYLAAQKKKILFQSFEHKTQQSPSGTIDASPVGHPLIQMKQQLINNYYVGSYQQQKQHKPLSPKISEAGITKRRSHQISDHQNNKMSEQEGISSSPSRTSLEQSNQQYPHISLSKSQNLYHSSNSYSKLHQINRSSVSNCYFPLQVSINKEQNSVHNTPLSIEKGEDVEQNIQQSKQIYQNKSPNNSIPFSKNFHNIINSNNNQQLSNSILNQNESPAQNFCLNGSYYCNSTTNSLNPIFTKSQSNQKITSNQQVINNLQTSNKNQSKVNSNLVSSIPKLSPQQAFFHHPQSHQQNSPLLLAQQVEDSLNTPQKTNHSMKNLKRNEVKLKYFLPQGQSNSTVQFTLPTRSKTPLQIHDNSSQPNQSPRNLDQQKYIKKTQQIIKGLKGPTGQSTANNQEKLDDLDQEVLEMMNSLSLYDQAQKGLTISHDSTKYSESRNGIVACYSAKTNQGIVRNYNEDRVSIILNITKPVCRLGEERWPKCSFFGIYDGHGGIGCSDFLRDNLHQFVIKEPSFPWNPKEAIKNGFEQAEFQFLIQTQKAGGGYDRSGSCAIVVLIVGEMCYVANVGDSRAILSSDYGKNINSLTRDHKPMDSFENNRIHQNGGSVYQTKIETISNSSEPESMLGPYRVLPGRLSVTRTFGDIEAKFPKYGGNSKVVISTPDIKSFQIQSCHDFIVLGCDGIFDKVKSSEIGDVIWETLKVEQSVDNVHQFCGRAVETVMKLSLARKSFDNVTAIIIGFDNFQRGITEQFNNLKSSKERSKTEGEEERQFCLLKGINYSVSQKQIKCIDTKKRKDGVNQQESNCQVKEDKFQSGAISERKVSQKLMKKESEGRQKTLTTFSEHFSKEKRSTNDISNLKNSNMFPK